MKHVSTVGLPVKKGAGVHAPSSQEQMAARQSTGEVVNRLFLQLMDIFPAYQQAWRDDAALDRAKRQWTKALIEAGINRVEQIRFGIARCRMEPCDFVPGPGKFVAWCMPTPEQVGLPPSEHAFREALRMAHPCMVGRIDDATAWSHPGVRHAALESGLYSLGRLQMEPARLLFSRNYEVVCRMVMNGEPLREIPKALPSSVSLPADPVKARSALDALRATLNGSRP